MGTVELILIAVGLSMDAFAVALCKGLSLQKVRMRDVVLIAAFFGGFQAFMPFIGWLLGSRFEKYIQAFDHWVAFLLLLFIGGKMIVEAFQKTEEQQRPLSKVDIRELFVLAIATSIDALAVGITFAFLSMPVAPSVLAIGVITFVLSLIGVWVGHVFGMKYKRRAELFGGIVLVFIGAKILLEHLEIISF